MHRKHSNLTCYFSMNIILNCPKLFATFHTIIQLRKKEEVKGLATGD